jgi:hypothetical protein
MAGELFIPDLSTGFLEATYPDPIPMGHGESMLNSNFMQVDNAQMDYLQMEKAGFPPSRLPGHAFCPLALRNYLVLADPYAEKYVSPVRGHRIPVMSAQATFVTALWTGAIQPVPRDLEQLR